jgi:uncharacterized protein YjbI with pentapeptide repeats
MLKRWVALPRSSRWLAGGIAVVVLAVAVAWVLFVPVADWLAHHDVGSAKPPALQTARDAARGRLLTLGAGLLAAGALLFTARSFTLSRRTFELTEQGQVTDRYTKAIEQLGSTNPTVRTGGIYALERVARDSARDQYTVMEVLAAFIRDHSRNQPPLPNSGAVPLRTIDLDLQAAVTVIGRRNPAITSRIDLTGAGLSGAILSVAELSHADLRSTDLSGADLTGVNLAGANLADTKLVGADLSPLFRRTTSAVRKIQGSPDVVTDPYLDLTPTQLTRAEIRSSSGGIRFFVISLSSTITNYLIRTDLSGANLTSADLTSADLRGANLTRADLTRADLTQANLSDANVAMADLSDANLSHANLSHANLSHANLSHAKLSDADLAGADFAGVIWPRDTPVPKGWKLNTGSGRLERAGTDSGPAEAN